MGGLIISRFGKAKTNNKKNMATHRPISGSGTFASVMTDLHDETETHTLDNFSRPTAMALSTVLKSPLWRQRFRFYLEGMHMEECLDCLDATEEFKTCSTTGIRVGHAKTIINQFCLDSSPQQVNLSGPTKVFLGELMEKGELSNFGNHDFFDQVEKEILKDMRQSEAFRFFLEDNEQ